MSRKREKAKLMRKMPTTFRNGKWEYKVECFEVRVMARAEGYAMVRRKGGMPFVCSEKELFTEEPTP